MTIGIVDYGMGNLRSIQNALEFLGARSELVSTKDQVLRAGKLILPGVGAFQKAMANLKERGLIEPVVEAARSGTPLLGICLGMQLLAERGDEGGVCEGLGLIKGSVRRLPSLEGIRVPHMGFNELRFRCSHSLFNGISDGSHFYFTHSYYMDCEASKVLAVTTHGMDVTAVVAHSNILGTQFHPEKSQSHGLRLLANFCVMKTC